jgi:hypothetical protein
MSEEQREGFEAFLPKSADQCATDAMKDAVSSASGKIKKIVQEVQELRSDARTVLESTEKINGTCFELLSLKVSFLIFKSMIQSLSLH